MTLTAFALRRVKIERALKEHDYRPNVFAINQNRRTTKNIGVIVPNLADPFFSEIGREVELACIKAGYNPIVMSSHGNPSMERDNLQALKSFKPAGLLLAPFGRFSDHDEIRKFEQDFPTVLFDANIDAVGQAFVGTNNDMSVDMMVDYLCRSGQPPCFFEMKTPTNPNANKRRHAYLNSMQRRGHTAHVYQAEGEGWDFEEIGSVEGGKLLAENAFETDTVLCSNDRLAIGMLSAAYNLGIRVGHKKKVACASPAMTITRSHDSPAPAHNDRPGLQGDREPRRRYPARHSRRRSKAVRTRGNLL